MSSIGIRRLPAGRPSVRPLPRGLGLALGALVSLSLWAGLIRGGLALFGG